MKRVVIMIVSLVILVGGGYWLFTYITANNNTPTNLPTAEDIERMRAIEESSSQVAPDAVPGAGVRPVGSLPPKTIETATTSTTTDESVATSSEELE